MKYPPHLYTIVVDFGPNIAPFQQHHADQGRASRVLAELRTRMTKTEGRCIEKLQLWHKGAIVSTYAANPPMATWLPPPDADGIRRIPEKGRKPKRLPSTTPITEAELAELSL